MKSINRWLLLYLLLGIITVILLATANLLFAVLLWVIASIIIVLYHQFKTSHVERRYFMLRLLSAILKINGSIYLISAISSQFFMWALQNRMFPPDAPNFTLPFTFIPSFITFLVTPLPIVAGIFAFILLYGVGQLIDLIMAYEENHRPNNL